MYLGQGYSWAKQSPPIPEPETHCDCGHPREPTDFLCWECRDAIDRVYKTEKENATMADFIIPDDMPSGNRVCYRCGGYGIIPEWLGMMQTAADCPDCNCRGWIANA